MEPAGEADFEEAGGGQCLVNGGLASVRSQGQLAGGQSECQRRLLRDAGTVLRREEAGNRSVLQGFQ
jgi:hypothetical protein